MSDTYFNSRINPDRSKGPMAPIAPTDHELVMRDRNKAGDTYLRRLINRYLSGEGEDFSKPFTEVSIFEIMSMKKGLLSGGVKDSYDKGKDLYRVSHNAVKALFGMIKEEKTFDPLDKGSFNASYYRDEEVERGTVERMQGDARGIGGARMRDRVFVNPEDTRNQIEGPGAFKRLRGPVDGARESDPRAMRALPPPAKQLPPPSREEIQAAKGRAAAREAQDGMKGAGKKPRGKDADQR